MKPVQDFLFAPAGSRGIVATRVIVALHALWIVLSRPCLPSLFAWPHEFWAGVPAATLTRYAWSGGSIERPLFILLILLLPAAVFSRACSLTCSVLLYHFAPLEDAMIGSPGPGVRGLTVDVLALAILAFAPAIRRRETSGDYRWPVILVRFAVASQCTFATVAKLRVTGIDWFSGGNIEGLAHTFKLLGIAPHPDPVIGHPMLAWLIGAGWLIISIGMMAAVLSRWTAGVVVPLTAAAHVAAAFLFGIVWLAAPLLLVFADFDQRVTPNSSAHRASA
jgi:hypothetical protein